MRKGELVLGIILAVSMVCAASCGSKTIYGNNEPTTYNTIKKEAPETKHPTVIIPEIKTPSPTLSSEPAMTKDPIKGNVSKKPVKKISKPVKNINGMSPILTTIASYMSEGENYDASDDACFYSIMYMLGNNVAEKCGKTEYKRLDDQIYVNEKAMQSLSAAAFTDHKVIGKLKEDFKDIIEYDAKKNVYIMYESDAGDVVGKIKDSKDNGNGMYTVLFELCTGNGESIGSYEFTLVQNQSKYLKVSPNFYYRVKSVKKLTE